MDDNSIGERKGADCITGIDYQFPAEANDLSFLVFRWKHGWPSSVKFAYASIVQFSYSVTPMFLVDLLSNVVKFCQVCFSIDTSWAI
jgi:hypothetical protein